MYYYSETVTQAVVELRLTADSSLNQIMVSAQQPTEAYQYEHQNLSQICNFSSK